ncbi:MAG: DNA polymerase III subunit beta [Candidatus Kapaibacteriales bacterium]
MKFSVELKELNNSLQKVSLALPRKSTIPALEHFYFILTADQLKIIATDQNITIMNQITVNPVEEGKVLVPGKRLNDIIKALDENKEITFSANPETFTVTIKSSHGKYSMKGLDPDDYLDLPELFHSQKPNIADMVAPLNPEDKIQTALITAKNLIWGAERTIDFVSKDDFKPAMTGVLFQFQGERLNFVSTDSYRLSCASIFKDSGNIFPTNLSVIIPARAVELLRKVSDDAIISFIKTDTSISHTRFDFSDVVLITRIIDETYPKYESVIPTTNNYFLKINKKELLSALRRVSLFANSYSKQVKLEIQPDSLTLIAEDEDTSSQGQETIPCEFNGSEFIVAFNHEYLSQAIENCVLDEEIENVILSFSEPTRPVLVKPENDQNRLIMLLMPIRL